MDKEEDCGAWLTFSEIGINARMRDKLELFAKRSPTHGPGSKELPAAVGVGGEISAAGLPSEDATHDGEGLVKRA